MSRIYRYGGRLFRNFSRDGRAVVTVQIPTMGGSGWGTSVPFTASGLGGEVGSRLATNGGLAVAPSLASSLMLSASELDDDGR